MPSPTNPRQIAFLTLREIDRRGAYTDIALDRSLRQAALKPEDRGLVTELVYGSVRRQRSLDTIIDRLGKKSSRQQPPDLRLLLHLGLYQLRYLSQIPPSAAVDTSVQLAKENRLQPLAGVVNGLLRQYLRLTGQGIDPLMLDLPGDAAQRLGVLHSFPDWIVRLWRSEFGEEETVQLCEWFNRPPTIDLRINPLKTTREAAAAAFAEAGIPVSPVPHLPQALRLGAGRRIIQELPGFAEGWWTVQDGSAQLAAHLLDPQPGETVIDACAAPGGKATHLAELMQDEGIVWAGDRSASRLGKLQENCQRLQLRSVKIRVGDSRQFPEFAAIADRALLDAPCSGLGTLHRHPDIRWRQSPAKVAELAARQDELLECVANWVKPKGILVYATCTLNPRENESVVEGFLRRHPDWCLQKPPTQSPAAAFVESGGWVRILPHRHQMDGFFLVKLARGD
jgi:16S rRNA (cytosine967-C5)-methyltransferase